MKFIFNQLQILLLSVTMVSIVLVEGFDENQTNRTDLHWNQIFADHQNWNGEVHPGSFDEGDEFAEELIRFFELGDSEIKLLDDVRDVVLIVGATGVGKSTLGYVLTEDESNPLLVQCNDNGVCNIVDQKGHIGNDTLISKTLLPNLILEKSMKPKTAFYDCPGFFDNRNGSVEIANSYFINKVALHARRLKIFIVTLFSNYNTSYRTRILALLKQIVQLFPTIHTYPNSVFMIGNRLTDFRRTDQQLYSITSNFLNLVINALESGLLSDWSENEVVKASILVKTLIGTGIQDSKLWYFTEPEYFDNGPISDFPRMIQAKEYIQNLIWNKTNYYENPKPSDFGFPLTDKGLNNLQSAAIGLASQIQTLLNKGFDLTLKDLQKIKDDVLLGDFNEFDDFVRTGISTMKAEFGRFDEYANISAFTDAVVETSRNFMPTKVENDLNRVATSAVYLAFINQINDYSNVTNPDSWIFSFHTLKLELINMLGDLSGYFDHSMRINAFDAVKAFGDYVNSLIHNFNEADSSNINALNDILQKMINSNYKALNDEDINEDLLSLMRTNREIIQGFSNSRIDDYLDVMVSQAERLQMLQTVNSTVKSVDTNKWVQPFIDLTADVSSLVTQKITPNVIKSAYEKVSQFTYSMFDSIKVKIDKNTSLESMLNVTSEIKAITSFAVSLIDKKLQLGSGTSFEDVIEFYIKQLSLIDNTLTDNDFKDIKSIYPSISLINNVGEINFESGYNWREPITQLDAALNGQINYFEFLRDLYKGLSSSGVHVVKKGSLHAWRRSNKVTNISNFLTLCDQLLKADINIGGSVRLETIVKHLTENSLDFHLLNTLLDYTLGIELSVCVCPKVFNGTLLFDTTNYLTISHVVECLNSVSVLPSRIVVLGPERVFIDSPLEIKKYSGLPVTIFLMGMTTEVQQVNIDLKGTDGTPPIPSKKPGNFGEIGAKGNNGGPASSFINIYGKRDVAPRVYITGGAGGQGQAGSDGKDGANGENKRFTIDKGDIVPQSECAAWSGGKINVRIYPNSCSSGSSTCHAGNNGVWVTLFGSDGQPGGPGGDGGVGGNGGQGGFSYELDVFSSNNAKIAVGNKGTTGAKGGKGNQGARGMRGGDNRYRIDDVTSGGQKRCKVMAKSESFRTNYLTLENNATVTDDTKWMTPLQMSPVTTNTFNIDPFKGSIREFVRIAESKLNVFNYNELTKFLKAVTSNPNLN